MQTIIVIGDWFIDENWLVSKHNTYSSSHIGHFHYLSKHAGVDKRMISLCGASELLEILRLHFEESNQYDIIGFGSWNRNDNDILQCTLCSDHTEEKHMTPYTIHSLLSTEKDRNNNRICPYKKKLYSSKKLKDIRCNYNPKLRNLSHADENTSTNRIIRCYEGHKSGEPNLLYRFDWQTPVGNLDYSQFEDLKTLEIAAVIIEDHGKGVVSDKTIKALLNNISSPQDVKWYIRSKMNNPTWIEQLKDFKIRLNVIDHKLARHIKGYRRWIFGNHLGRVSLELLGEMTGDRIWVHNDPKPNLERNPENHTERAAVIFDDNTFIAKDGTSCFHSRSPIGIKQLITIGRTTMFFVALIAQDLQDSSYNFGEQCLLALKCGFEWSQKATKAWKEEDLILYGSYSEALKHIDEMPNSLSSGTYHSIYDQEWSDWNKTSIRTGALSKNGIIKFEMWRGEGILEKYICVGGPKRNSINELVWRIAQFNEQNLPKHPFNCLLVASPGWGKSYLAKCLAEHFEMNYLEFSVAQMATTEDLINCFDTICSFQGRTSGKTLIFIDEVNSEIQGNTAMGLLLSPIWDGSFYKEGKTYKLSPSVWMFASTAPIEDIIGTNQNKGDSVKRINKGSDFVSRLNGPIIELDAPGDGQKILIETIKELKRELVAGASYDQSSEKIYKNILQLLPDHIKTEHVYLGISLLNSFWGPISKVQNDVLELLYNIVPINGFRSLEFYISKCQNIQRGAVVCSNMPSINQFNELKRHVVLPIEWVKRRPVDKSPEDPESIGEFVEVSTLAK